MLTFRRVAKRKNGSDGRARLLQAGIELFSRRNYDDISIDDLANAAGVAHGLAFHHFGSKRGLFDEVLREIAAQIDAVHVDHPVSDSPAELLRAFLHRHLTWVKANSAIFVTLNRGAKGFEYREAHARLDELRGVGARRVLETIGVEEAPVLNMLVHGFIGFLDEVTLEWLERPRTIALEDLLDALVAQFATTLRTAARLEPPAGSDYSAAFDDALAALSK